MPAVAALSFGDRQPGSSMPFLPRLLRTIPSGQDAKVTVWFAGELRGAPVEINFHFN
jgi:hypothetical protein